MNGFQVRRQRAFLKISLHPPRSAHTIHANRPDNAAICENVQMEREGVMGPPRASARNRRRPHCLRRRTSPRSRDAFLARARATELFLRTSLARALRGGESPGPTHAQIARARPPGPCIGGAARAPGRTPSNSIHAPCRVATPHMGSWPSSMAPCSAVATCYCRRWERRWPRCGASMRSGYAGRAARCHLGLRAATPPGPESVAWDTICRAGDSRLVALARSSNWRQWMEGPCMRHLHICIGGP
ncbi:hypothetical protein OBBRIDRAFT_265580 [Obba rivulosa]|uniref:Uncharacterized protein n=1 Tax=Obba rivulosa TaxID=1052685 RepID=A0A8E2DQA1_9APHY|nr:hypothetical protein OBBRIDRAFT_265580 [Obba rivulosa]